MPFKTEAMVQPKTGMQNPLTTYSAQEQEVVPVNPEMQVVHTEVDEQVLQPVKCEEQRVHMASPLGSGTYPEMHPQAQGIVLTGERN